MRSHGEPAPEPTDEHYTRAARAIYHGDDYDFDHKATVSVTDDDHGAWVQGWLWVPEASAVEAMKDQGGTKESQG